MNTKNEVPALKNTVPALTGTVKPTIALIELDLFCELNYLCKLSVYVLEISK